MRSKVARYVCRMCGAQLSGIGDWVEHACPNAVGKHAAGMPRTRRPSWPTHASEVHYQLTDTKRITTVSEPPTRTFELLLTDDDRAWMREIEKAFRQSERLPPGGCVRTCNSHEFTHR